jgi:hypothetical protein
MKVEIRLKPTTEKEKSAARLIESSLAVHERTITDPEQCFWVFADPDEVGRAQRVLASLEKILKLNFSRRSK